MTRTRSAQLVAAVLAVLLTAGSAAAQMKLGGVNLEGNVEAGGRFFADQPSDKERGKFDEYRDNDAGPYLFGLDLRLSRPDDRYDLELGGSKWGYQDQEFSLRGGRLGLWDFQFSWDQTPHVYSTDARSLFTETSPGVFRLPAGLAGNVAVDGPKYNAAPELDEISQRWDTAKMFLKLTPFPDLEIRVGYTRIKKDGEKPFGIADSSPGGNYAEILEPIDTTIHEVRARVSYLRPMWQIQGSYVFSLFDNALDSVTVDIPNSANVGYAQGRIALAPSNTAHTWQIGGGVNLPLHSRVSANASYSLRFQDVDFLPHTITAPVKDDPHLVLPQKSLDGQVGILNLYVNGVTRPLTPLTLTAKYRLFDYNDMSDQLILNGLIVNDQPSTFSTEREKTGPRPKFTKQNVDVEGRWRFDSLLATGLGAGWERWDRSHSREVPQSDELYARATIDGSPVEWFDWRLAYRPSFRRIDQYNTFAAELAREIVPLEEAEKTLLNSVLLRKYDEGERDRHQVDLNLTFTPLDALSVTLSGGWRYDDYIDSALGVQNETTWSAGLDFSWVAAEFLSFYGGYVHEDNLQKMRSRSRPVVGGVGLDLPSYDWISDLGDTADTFQFGVKATLIPRRLDWLTSATYAYALSTTKTRNPLRPTGSTAGNNATATARRFPAIEDQLFRLDTALRYHFWKSWTASVKYAFEAFEKNDWRTDTLNPFMPGSGSIWLGQDEKNYTAHIIGVSLAYQFR